MEERRIIHERIKQIDREMNHHERFQAACLFLIIILLLLPIFGLATVAMHFLHVPPEIGFIINSILMLSTLVWYKKPIKKVIIGTGLGCMIFIPITLIMIYFKVSGYIQFIVWLITTIIMIWLINLKRIEK